MLSLWRWPKVITLRGLHCIVFVWGDIYCFSWGPGDTIKIHISFVFTIFLQNTKTNPNGTFLEARALKSSICPYKTTQNCLTETFVNRPPKPLPFTDRFSDPLFLILGEVAFIVGGWQKRVELFSPEGDCQHQG